MKRTVIYGIIGFLFPYSIAWIFSWMLNTVDPTEYSIAGKVTLYYLMIMTSFFSVALERDVYSK